MKFLPPPAGAGSCQSLVTPWGLLRHYWVVLKLLITVVATVALMAYLDTFRFMAAMAGDPRADVGALRNWSPALQAVLALVMLLLATVLALFKPRGLTR